jgi:ribonuclease VapC
MLLDASALTAMFLREPGQEVVAALAPRALMTAPNLVEVLSHRALAENDVIRAVNMLQLTVLAFGPDQAGPAATLLRSYRGRLSLGDCACIATAQLLGIAVLTADRIWATLPLGIEVRLIRP